MKPVKSIYVVNSQEQVRDKIKKELGNLAGIQLRLFDNGGDCLKSLDNETVLVILEPEMRDMNGFDVLQMLKIKNPELDVIMLSENDDIDIAIQYLKSGARDYLINDGTAMKRILNLIERKKEQFIKPIVKEDYHPMSAFLLLSFTTMAIVITLLMKYYS